MRNHGPDTVTRWCCLVCLAVLRRHCTQQVQKRRRLFARNHALHPWTFCVCVYACTHGSCVDSIWLWACFWGLKNKHFWLRGCGPSLIAYKEGVCVCKKQYKVYILCIYKHLIGYFSLFLHVLTQKVRRKVHLWRQESCNVSTLHRKAQDTCKQWWLWGSKNLDLGDKILVDLESSGGNPWPDSLYRLQKNQPC